jgi:hypothetical protein
MLFCCDESPTSLLASVSAQVERTASNKATVHSLGPITTPSGTAEPHWQVTAARH